MFKDTPVAFTLKSFDVDSMETDPEDITLVNASPYDIYTQGSSAPETYFKVVNTQANEEGPIEDVPAPTSFIVDYTRRWNEPRWECPYANPYTHFKCLNKSVPYLIVPKDGKYFCPRHYEGRIGSDPERLQCVAITADRRRCRKQDYRVLHPGKDESSFLCHGHIGSNRGRIFRASVEDQGIYTLCRLKSKPSEDIRVTVRTGEDRVIFPGLLFDELTSGYGSKVKVEIRHTIEKYFNDLLSTKEEALANFHKYWQRYPNEDERKKIREKYRDLLARGFVYLAMPIGMDASALDMEGQFIEDGVLVKLGYTSDPATRLHQYPKACGLQFSPMETSKVVGFVYLLEKILHAILVCHQFDIACGCGRVHREFFRFQMLEGETHYDAFHGSTAMLWPHVLKWEGAIQALENVYETIKASHLGEHEQL